MLSTKACEVAVKPVMAKKDTTIGELRKLVNDPYAPIVYEEDGKIKGVIDARILRNLRATEKAADHVIPVEVFDGSLPLYEIAKLLLQFSAPSLPVECNEKVKAVSLKTILHSIKETKQLAKREAKTVMAPITSVRESKQDTAAESAARQMVEAIPIVNDAGKLVAVWINGKISRRPAVVREGTRVKLIVDKVLKNGAVVVIDKHREPKGIISIYELLNLAASYREFTAPIIYSGLEVLQKVEEADLKAEVEDLVRKVNQIVPVNYVTVRVTKRGVWKISIRISTKWRMYMATREATDFYKAVKEIVEVLEREVLEDKEKRKKLRTI